MEYDSFDRDTEQFVRLCELDDDRQRDLLLTLLKEAGIPAFSRDNGAGNYVRIVTGGSIFGSKIFVPISCQAQAEQLCGTVLRKDQPEFSEAELDSAYDDYMKQHPQQTAEAESNGAYHLLKYFLLGFGLLLAAALLVMLFK